VARGRTPSVAPPLHAPAAPLVSMVRPLACPPRGAQGLVPLDLTARHGLRPPPLALGDTGVGPKRLRALCVPVDGTAAPLGLLALLVQGCAAPEPTALLEPPHPLRAPWAPTALLHQPTSRFAP
jgi:hypothetical protein